MVTHRRAEACSQATAASLKRDVWGQAGWLLVGFNEPNGAVVKVAEKLLIVWRTHFTSPHHLGVVDIGAVVDPLISQAVVGGIADDGQLRPRKAIEAPESSGSVKVAGIRSRGVRIDYLPREGRNAQQRSRANQEEARHAAADARMTQVAHRLKDDDIERAGHGGEVVRLDVSLRREANEEDEAGEKPETRSAVPQDQGEGDQGNGQGDSEIKAPDSQGFIVGRDQPTIRRVLQVSALQARLRLHVELA